MRNWTMLLVWLGALSLLALGCPEGDDDTADDDSAGDDDAMDDDAGDDDAGDDDAGDDDAGDDDAGDDDAGDDDSGNPVTFAQVQSAIFDAKCVSCHGTSGGLALEPAGSYANIVDVPSTQLPSMDLVEPGNPGSSYLWHKVDGTQAKVGGSGDQMPATGGPLGNALRGMLEDWIASGAPH